MLNWGAEVPRAPSAADALPAPLPRPAAPRGVRPRHRRGAVRVPPTACVDLQTRFLRIVAAGLGVDGGYFDDILADGSHLTRAIHYPPMDARAVDRIRVGRRAHRHQPRHRAAARDERRVAAAARPTGWVDVVPPEGHVVVNSGIMLERMSNGRIPAGVHRVVADGTPGDRFSVVQFCHPAPWFALAPLPTCVDEAHPLRYGTIEAGALLDRVLYDIGLIGPDASDSG